MPLDLHIIRATDFIQVDPQGHFDLAASKEALALLAGACRKRGINQALMDLRALHPGPKPVFTPADLAALVSTFPEVGFTQQHHLAILYQSDPHKRARLFAFLSSMHGWHVRAFGDFEEAVLWLSSSQVDTAESERSPGERQVPVRVSTRKTTPPKPTRLPFRTPAKPASPPGKGRPGTSSP